ncbi:MULTISPECIES: alpha/beta fold hydrolase [Gordonia]|uniref:alpha/beta fold hydrolase n=1 Tax=Gordonia TaxID=2053 RepID=UPI00199C87E7|nr:MULTISPECIES: alpha/beta fold hydrolase [Gordonia]MBD0023592.1 alpha/beta fold hydrolase [Gordonia sp. (in: high G+C Gram-positive bacteria)]
MSPEILQRAQRSVRHLVRPYPLRDIPAGSMLDLPGRGRTFVTDSGPRDAPAVILLHSVLTTGLLCWYPVIPALNERYRVITLDHRRHGRGIRSDDFSLDDAADDTVAVADALGVDRFTAAGFSMGGGIAQLIWRRHPGRLNGMVLCSTGPFFSEQDPRAQAVADRVGRLATPVYRMLPKSVRLDDTDAHTTVWAFRQFLSTSLPDFGMFGEGLGRFDSRDWLGDIDVPTSVLVSTRDKVVPPSRQQLLLDGIPGARRFEVHGGHACCVLGAEDFIAPFGAAVDAVAIRGTLAPPTP